MFVKSLIEIRGLVFVGAIIATIWTFGGNGQATDNFATLCIENKQGPITFKL